MAVTLGAGGVAIVAAGGGSSTFVPVTPERILDTRTGLGLEGPFTSPTARSLQVTGSVPTTAGNRTVVPGGATAVVLNVTAVQPTADGFVSVRPDGTPGPPATSNLNFTAGAIVPNAVTVALPTSGAIDIVFDAFGAVGPTSDLLIDVTGYFVTTGDGSGTAGSPGPAGPSGPAGSAGPPGPAGNDAFTSDRVVWVDTAGTPDGSNGAFDSVQAAIDSIDDATNDNPALVRIAPGTYTGVVDLVSNVHLEGSGLGATILTAPGVQVSNVLLDFGAGTIRAQGVLRTEVRDLTVVNEGGPSVSNLNNVGVWMSGTTAALRFRDVAVVAFAAGSANAQGWVGYQGAASLERVDSRSVSLGSGLSRAAFGQQWSPVIRDSRFAADANSGFSSGLDLRASDATLERVRASAGTQTGSSATAVASSQGSTVEIIGGDFSGREGLAANGTDTVVTVRDARLAGTTTAVLVVASGSVLIAGSMVDGTVEEGSGGEATCREVYGPDLASVTC